MLESLFIPLDFLDGLMAGWLSELVRICVWGFVSGAAAMLLYLVTSDQESIVVLKKETSDLRKRMLKEDLPYNEVMNLMKENLLVSFRFLRKVLTPSLLASIPVLLIALWLGAFLTYTLPENSESVSMDIVPPDSELSFKPENRFIKHGDKVYFLPGKNADPVSILSNKGLVYSGRPDNGPVSVVYKRQWWNTLVENGAGYIEPESPAQEIRWNFPRKLFLESVPAWVATWEFPFFFSVFIVAFVLKVVLRIQ
ncbi:MAG: hypothetical protein ABFS45_00870 [Pseudomonadota bacterium]